MKTYIAKIETSQGSQQTQLAALNIQEAQKQIEALTKTGGDTTVRYSIQEQPARLEPDMTSVLLNASGGMVACIVILIVANQYLRRHFLDGMRGRI